jgi:ferrous iron transport protein A
MAHSLHLLSSQPLHQPAVPGDVSVPVPPRAGAALLTLAELPTGSHATVAGLHAASPEADAALLRRLEEIGFVAGEPVHLLHRGPGGREPLAVQVGDTLFALRLVEARCVLLESPHD